MDDRNKVTICSITKDTPFKNKAIEENISSPNGPSLEQKMHAMPWLAAQSPFHTFFGLLTIFGTVFVLFLDELNLDKTKIGFLLSLIPFCGIISLFVAPWVAKIGTKRIFLVFYYLRSFAAVLLLLTPFLLSISPFSAFIWIATTISIIAICRSIAETALWSWQQEFIPDSIRGRMSAVTSNLAALAGIVSVGFASYMLKHNASLGIFMILIFIGSVAGVISTSCFLFIPGGHPDHHRGENSTHLDGIIGAFRDKNFILFLVVLGVALIGVALPMYFVPLFLKQKVAMPIDKIILLEISTNLGAFLSVFFWGWASDRYGSKPIMLTSLWCLLSIPILWAVFPRHYNSACIILAIMIVFFYGIGSVGWMTGWCRYLFTGAMPAEKKTAYTSVFYAWISVTGGFAPLINGWLADMTAGVDGRYGLVIVDSYTLLFILCFLCFLLCLVLVFFVRADSSYTMLKFLKSLIIGEPIIALLKRLRRT